MRIACRLQCLSLLAVVGGLGCVSYRDRIVYVREQTRVEAPAAGVQVNVTTQVSLWQLPATPPRLDAPTLRRALEASAACKGLAWSLHACTVDVQGLVCA